MTLPRISDLTVRAVNAPLTAPHKTASGTMTFAPLVLLDLETDAGITGRAYIITYTPLALKPAAEMVSNFTEMLLGLPLHPRDISGMLSDKCKLLGTQGVVGMAIALIDMAIWDALARHMDQPLSVLLGSEPRDIPVYDSLGQMSATEIKAEIEQSRRRGFDAFKIKAGQPDPMIDVDVVHAIRDIAGENCWIAADFNQAFMAPEAVRRMDIFEERDSRLAWIEEPVRATDYTGHAHVRSCIQTPVQTGENWWGLPDMTLSIEADASDLAMPDAMRVGGVTGWMDCAGLATAHGLPVSSHLFAEFSVHLLAATPTAQRLEWFDVAASIRANQMTIRNGHVGPLPGPGAGIEWNEHAIENYRV